MRIVSRLGDFSSRSARLQQWNRTPVSWGMFLDAEIGFGTRKLMMDACLIKHHAKRLVPQENIDSCSIKQHTKRVTRKQRYFTLFATIARIPFIFSYSYIFIRFIALLYIISY